MTEETKLWFWRRLLASMIDVILGALVFTLLFVMVFGSSSDRVRLRDFVVSERHCSSTKASDEVRAVAEKSVPNATWTREVVCTVTSFGLAEDRSVLLEQREQRDGMVITRLASVPVDEAGRPVTPFYADWIGYAFALAGIVAFLASRMQATPGLRLLGLRLEMADGTRPTLRTVVVRELCILILPFLIALPFLFIAWGLVTGLAAGAIGSGTAFAFVVLLVLSAWALLFLWWRPFTIRSEWPRAPLHDVLARTRMVRAER